MNITPFNPAHSQEVIELYTAVFSASEGAAEGQSIGDLVSRLIATTEPRDLIGFVASAEGGIAGCIFFSRLFLSEDENAFILSPVAVSTDLQGRGIGQQLINHGLDHLRQLGVRLVFTYGDPNYYARVGFRQISEDLVKAPLSLSQPEGWLAQALDGEVIQPVQGTSRCVEALNDQRYW